MDAGGSWELGWSRASASQAQARTDCSHPKTTTPGPPGDPRAESPLDPRQSAGGKERGLQTAPRPPGGERGGKASPGRDRGSRTGRSNILGGLFLLPKQNRLGVFPEKPVPAPKAPRVEETRPNPFYSLCQGGVMASSGRNSPFSRTFISVRADGEPVRPHPDAGVLQRVPLEEEEGD